MEGPFNIALQRALRQKFRFNIVAKGCAHKVAALSNQVGPAVFASPGAPQLRLVQLANLIHLQPRADCVDSRHIELGGKLLQGMKGLQRVFFVLNKGYDG